jgi:hypothetical protein
MSIGPRLRQLLRVFVSIAGAAVLGVATIFQAKARPDDHWSTSPTVQVVEERETAASGGRRRSSARKPR